MAVDYDMVAASQYFYRAFMQIGIAFALWTDEIFYVVLSTSICVKTKMSVIWELS